MTMHIGMEGDVDERIRETIQRYWGFDQLRPMQAEAIHAGLTQQDSLVVLPTGGGKSLCYQVPPAVAGRLDVVISPLIALMQDQVEGLRQNGYPAVALHSGLSDEERRVMDEELRGGAAHLLFISPERLLRDGTLRMVRELGVSSFIIDEAHCISQWGHDFRPEYRQMARLREWFPDASIHGYTATATPRVREDIIVQLGLRDPQVLVGVFDRPNLIYRIKPAVDVKQQTFETIRRHRREAVIVYCQTRNDTEETASYLTERGVQAAAYHAGMQKSERSSVQRAFAEEKLQVVAATVAFGMGIDRSNVRCVIHAAVPKSIEHYQQETGRAGRDGLEAECVLFYSASSIIRWEGLIRRSAARAEDVEAVAEAQLELLRRMQGMCSTLGCRHRALSRYFGQSYDRDDCGACDVCLGEVTGMKGATVTAQKILSCVYRTGQSFGVGHITQVLCGSRAEGVLSRGHDELTTFGLLKPMPEKVVQNLVYQLIDQGLLERTPGDRPVLHLTDDAVRVLRGELEVRLIDPRADLVRTSAVAREAWEGVDTDMFERLRLWRKSTAIERDLPAYMIFSDATLRELARMKPDTLIELRRVPGIGEQKMQQYGETVIEIIRTGGVTPAR